MVDSQSISDASTDAPRPGARWVPSRRCCGVEGAVMATGMRSAVRRPLAAMVVLVVVAGISACSAPTRAAAPVPTASPAPDWATHPFAADAPANRTIPATATYEPADGPLSTALRAEGRSNVNQAGWSFAFFQATASDPYVTVREEGTYHTQVRLRMPADAS